MLKSAEQHFLRLAAFLFFLSALSKLLTAGVASQVLDQPDPLLAITVRWALVLVGTLELLVSAFLLASRNNLKKLGLAAWFSANVLIYRIGLAGAGDPNFGDCLGNFNAWLPIPSWVFSMATLGTFILSLVGSCTFLILDLTGKTAGEKPVPGNQISQSQGSESQSRPAFAFKQLFGVWGSAGTLLGILIAILHLHSSSAMPKHFGPMLDEICSIGNFRGAPVVNHANTKLMYMRETTNGLGGWLVDLATLERREIGLVDKTEGDPAGYFTIIGWSPNDRYLAFTLDSGYNRTLVISDGDNGTFLKTFPFCDYNDQWHFGFLNEIRQGVWLDNDNLVLMNRFHRLYLVNLKSNRIQEFKNCTTIGPDPPYSLVKVAEHGIAYVDEDTIKTLDISTGVAGHLINLTNAAAEWLDYSPANGQYLFCMPDPNDTGGEKTDRYVYRFDPGATNDSLVRLTDIHSFKAQWIYGNTGIAYVGTRGTANFLAIETKDPALRTNLFESGRVLTLTLIRGNILAYSVSPDRNRIYAVASTNHEPLGIWEYDVAKRNLRNVVPGMEQPFTTTQIVVPVEKLATNDSEETIPYYILPPPELDPHKKYPLVIDQPTDDRCEQGSQLLANAGIFYASVNRHGLASFENLGTAHADILAVRKELLKNPNIDPNRIYLAGISASVAIVYQLVSDDPSFWRGMLLLSPADFPTMPHGAVRFPSIFVSIGEQDSTNLLAETQQLEKEACREHIRMQVVYHKNASHIFNNTQAVKERYGAITRFILTGY